MFGFGNRTNIKPELANYIKESLNKSMNKFKEIHSLKKIYNSKETPYTNNVYLLPFVSLFSFLVCYNFRILIRKTIY